jgi:hypothetical protein
MLTTFKDGEDIKISYTWWKNNDFDVKPILQVGDILGVNHAISTTWGIIDHKIVGIKSWSFISYKFLDT